MSRNSANNYVGVYFKKTYLHFLLRRFCIEISTKDLCKLPNITEHYKLITLKTQAKTKMII